MIEVGPDGQATFSLPETTNFRGDGTERVGYGDGKPWVNFYAKSVSFGAEALEAGKPVFKRVVFFKLQHPGERDTIDRIATRFDAQKYPVEYRAFQENRAGGPDGIPLDILFPHHPDIVQGLNYQRVFTVEQLAHLSDTQLQNMGMGGMEWQNKARTYLAHLKEGGGYARMEHTIEKQGRDLDRKEMELTSLRQTVATLQAQMATLQGALGASTLPGGMGQAPGAAALPTYLQAQPHIPVPMRPQEPAFLDADAGIASLQARYDQPAEPEVDLSDPMLHENIINQAQGKPERRSRR